MGPKINTERFFRDLDGLREIGRQGNGVVRISLDPADMASRRWLVERFGEAGLKSKIDGVGNVVGISPNPGSALLLGSHTDTQLIGGWLDGAYGVISALEAARKPPIWQLMSPAFWMRKATITVLSATCQPPVR